MGISVKWAGLLTVSVLACGVPTATGDVAASAAPVGAPLSFGPDAGIPTWHVEATREDTRPVFPRATDADRAEFTLVARGCATDASIARKLCPPSPDPRHVVCLVVCLDALEEALRTSATVTPVVTPTSPARLPVAAPIRMPDSFEHALRRCIVDVLESGGEAPAVCHFDRPLDEMDFGQKHCDERCARATGKRP